MNTKPDPFIDGLVVQLAPVTPMKASAGLGGAAASLAVAIVMVVALMGLRRDISALFLLSSGLFLLLGAAASLSVIMMGRPSVGSEHGGWVWAAAMAALLPATTLLMGVTHGPAAWTESDPETGVLCLAMGLLFGLVTGGVLVAWLRRGAPTSPERAGLLTGIAAGSFGIFAFSLHCPSNDLYHIGLWHSLAVVVAAMIGRLAVPRLIRW
ncbi:MAG: DUF1109 domain-containing protein [Sphingomonadales bacterium]|nr:DUF1109 domain-containing protein [Sphingomonadales bacterium]MDE2169308.1 DUF1109 domain-containing protein [Sphingomonadales bacterium]